MAQELTTILILLPFVSAILVYLIRVSAIRSLIVLLTGFTLIACSLLLIPYAPFTWSPHDRFRREPVSDYRQVVATVNFRHGDANTI